MHGKKLSVSGPDPMRLKKNWRQIRGWNISPSLPLSPHGVSEELISWAIVGQRLHGTAPDGFRLQH
ncbi:MULTISPECIES: hypothetical protein [Rhizobium]|uniref:Uncharacterized protein n=1 Tax=Rhizobium tropici TaxID=398 RepID=A0A6P1C4G4_RHITR|nr:MULTISPECIES: hypothetical protein [Rhizobium]AGB69728.1 hypothetical protein RTCIAT899_CH01545 [Rhizobium tropici CIAT 899]MBB4239884.1 hypothetical protein [Rhizobium tropici]MBB5591154.1 hypothetical protein [Rhizobium tropici]MBB6489637.1 hypothetical protein [Rhizobium tropici]NEV11968.1 hypothetical protein [Rhizobium tropici]